MRARGAWIDPDCLVLKLQEFCPTWDRSPQSVEFHHVVLTCPETRSYQRINHMVIPMSFYSPIKDSGTANNRKMQAHREPEPLQNELHYRALMDFFPAAILQHRGGTIVYANDSACRLLGVLHPEELIGTPILAIVPPEYQEPLSARIDESMFVIGKVSSRLEEKVVHRDGSQIEVEIVEMHILNQGLPTIQVTMLDISARKQVKQTIREGENAIKNLIEVLPVGVAVMGFDGSMKYVNRCFEETFGYSHGEISTISEWLQSAYPDPNYRKSLVAQLDETLFHAQETGKPMQPVEVNVTCKDGSVRHVILNRQIAGQSKIAIHIDITERESRQNEFLSKVSFQLLWAEERERERIAGELHDHVGQSLLLANMKLGVLKSMLPSGRNLLLAEETANLLDSSIQDVRTLTIRARPTILDIAGIETALEWLCCAVNKDYSAKIVFSNDRHPKPVAPEERYLIYQSVRELLLNVIKHAKTDRAFLSLSTENNALVIQLKDEGVGFSLSEMRAKQKNGCAYGLYHVQQRVEHIGGKFTAESEPNKGTTIRLTVPLTAAKGRVHGNDCTAHSRRSKKSRME